MISTHEGRTDGLAEELGYDSRALEALQAHYESLIASGTLQGASYLIARKGQVIARRSLGKLNHMDNSPELMPDSIRKTYSITKAFTSVAIGQLIDRGLLHLHQSAGTLLPEMDTSKHREITIFHLLTHTSGLRGDPGFHNEPYPLPWFERIIREYCNDQHGISWIQSILAGPLQAMPGKEWIYSTSAYALLGAIISKVTGKPYETYIREEILEPLGMDRSFFAVPEALWSEVCVTQDWETEALHFSIKPREEAPPKSGNGLYSCLDDLWKFGQMMLNGGHLDGKRILSARGGEVITSNHLKGIAHKGWGSRHTDYPFGLGWSLEHYDLCSQGTFSHEGFGHSGLFADPAEELVFAFFVPSAKGYTNESVLMPRAIVWSGLLAKTETSYPPTPPRSITRVTPEEAGYEQHNILRLEEHFDRLIAAGLVQCASYLLSRDGEIFADGATGPLRHDDSAGKLELNSIRRIASITKLFTAVAIFQLIERGTLFLRQPVAEWIQEFKQPMYEKVTIMQLLNHTSGLPADGGYYLEPYPASWWAVLFAYQPETEGPWAVKDPEELEEQRRSAWIRAILGGKPLSEPGTEWSYSTAGYAILGEIIARASGKTYEQYILEHIAEPLGMTRTFFDVPEELRQEVCLVADYENERLTTERNDSQYFPPPSGGGLYSTLPDLFNFGQMLLNGGSFGGVKILSRKSVEKMSANCLEPGLFAFDWGGKCESKMYGIGPSLIGAGEWQPEGSFGHEGAGRSKLVLDLKHNAVMVYFVPSNNDWSPESVIGTLNIMGAGWR